MGRCSVLRQRFCSSWVRPKSPYPGCRGSFIAKTLISSIFFEIFTFLISFTAMIFLEWRLAVVMIVLVPLLILLMVFLSPKLAEYSNKILSSEENNRQEIQDFLDNYLVVKSYGLAGWMKKRMALFLSCKA